MKATEGPGPERIFGIFRELVEIDSESGNEAQVSAYIQGFSRAVGFECIEDRAHEAAGGNCGNLFVKVPGNGRTPPVILSAHMDTVAPGRGVTLVDCGERFSSDGTTVLGADCKAGITAILAAVESLAKNGERHRALELVFTVQEEVGLLGAKSMDGSILEGRWGVVLDGSGPVGGIIVEAPGQDQFKFTVRGKPAHAGVEPEKGISAVACASEAVAGLRLGRHDDATTSNVGMISGGRALNIVPDLCTVSGEIRSLSGERLDQEREAAIDVFRRAASRRGCELEVEIVRQFEHFRLDDESRTVRFVRRAMERSGMQPTIESSGGGSDANVLNGSGFEMAVLQIGLENAHTGVESVLKDDLIALERIVRELAVVSMDEEVETGG